jgi:diphthine-ammonia ligase
VCARLGLVSLAYMWHQPQPALLRGMLDSGIRAVLVKVAAMGLEPARHLGADLASVRAHLHRIRRCAVQHQLHAPA